MKGKRKASPNKKRGPQDDMVGGESSPKKVKKETKAMGKSNLAENPGKAEPSKRRSGVNVAASHSSGESIDVTESEQTISHVTTPTPDLTPGRSRRKITPTTKLLNLAGKSGFDRMLGRKSGKGDPQVSSTPTRTRKDGSSEIPTVDDKSIKTHKKNNNSGEDSQEKSKGGTTKTLDNIIKTALIAKNTGRKCTGVSPVTRDTQGKCAVADDDKSIQDLCAGMTPTVVTTPRRSGRALTAKGNQEKSDATNLIPKETCDVQGREDDSAGVTIVSKDTKGSPTDTTHISIQADTEGSFTGLEDQANNDANIIQKCVVANTRDDNEGKMKGNQMEDQVCVNKGNGGSALVKQSGLTQENGNFLTEIKSPKGKNLVKMQVTGGVIVATSQPIEPTQSDNPAVRSDSLSEKVTMKLHEVIPTGKTYYQNTSENIEQWGKETSLKSSGSENLNLIEGSPSMKAKEPYQGSSVEQQKGGSVFVSPLAKISTATDSKVSKPMAFIQKVTPSSQYRSLNYLQCSCCFADFGFYRHLQLHIQSHHASKSYICFKCGLGVTALDGAIDRIKMEHVKTCEQNEKTFIYACNECNQRFGKKKLALVHDVLEHLGYSQLKYVCDVCYKDQGNEEQFIMHYKDCVLHKYQEVFQADGLDGIMMQNERMNMKNEVMDDTDFMKKLIRKMSETQELSQTSSNKSSVQKNVNIRELARTYVGKLLSFSDLFLVLGQPEDGSMAIDDANDASIGKFLCTICDVRWDDYTEFFLHLTEHPGLFPFICLSCGEGSTFKTLHEKFFTQNEHSERHSTNQENLPYYCNLCSLRFSSAQLRHLHRRYHLMKGLFVCRKCKKDFLTSQTYFQHQCPEDPNNLPDVFKVAEPPRIHTRKIVESHKKRKIQYSKFAGVKRKIRDAKLIVTNPQRKYANVFECPVCKAQHKVGGFMCKHSWNMSFTGGCVCTDCGKIFSKSSFLKNHAVKVHDHGQKCSDCSKRFSNDLKLRQHMTREHNYQPLEATDHDYLLQNEKSQPGKRRRFRGMKSFSSNNPSDFIMRLDNKYVCIKCGKIYTGVKEDYILKHVRTEHLDEKRDSCNYCHKRFVFKSDLKSHIELHHGNKIRCRICYKLLSSKHTYAMHMQICHKKSVSTEALTKFECNICCKQFRNARRFREHKAKKHNCESRDQNVPGLRHESTARGKKRNKAESANIPVNDEKAKSLKTDEAIAFIQQQLQESPIKALPGRNDSTQNTSTVITNRSVRNVKTDTSNSDDEMESYEGKTFTCGSCDFQTSGLQAMEKHCKAKHDLPKYRCNLCQVICPGKSSATLHRKEFHAKLRDNSCFSEINERTSLVSSNDYGVKKTPTKNQSRSRPSSQDLPSTPKVVAIKIKQEQEGRSRMAKSLNLESGTKSLSALDSEEEENRIANARKYLSPVKRSVANPSPTQTIKVQTEGRDKVIKFGDNVDRNLKPREFNESDTADVEVTEDGNYTHRVPESDALLLHHFGSINRNLSGAELSLKESLEKSILEEDDSRTMTENTEENSVTENREEKPQSLNTPIKVTNDLVPIENEDTEKIDESKLIDNINSSLVEKEVIIKAVENKQETTCIVSNPFEDLGQVIQVIEEIPENIDIDNIISNNMDKTFKMTESSVTRVSEKENGTVSIKKLHDDGQGGIRKKPSDSKGNNSVHKEINVPRRLMAPYQAMIDLPDPSEGIFNAVINLPDDVKSVNLTVANMDNDDENVYLLFAI